MPFCRQDFIQGIQSSHGRRLQQPYKVLDLTSRRNSLTTPRCSDFQYAEVLFRIPKCCWCITQAGMVAPAVWNSGLLAASPSLKNQCVNWHLKATEHSRLQCGQGAQTLLILQEDTPNVHSPSLLLQAHSQTFLKVAQAQLLLHHYSYMLLPTFHTTRCSRDPAPFGRITSNSCIELYISGRPGMLVPLATAVTSCSTPMVMVSPCQ